MTNLDKIAGEVKHPGSVKITEIKKVRDNKYSVTFQYPSKDFGLVFIEGNSEQKVLDVLAQKVERNTDFSYVDKPVFFINGEGERIEGLCTGANYFYYIINSNGTTYYSNKVRFLNKNRR